MELRDKNVLNQQEFLERYRPGGFVRPTKTVEQAATYFKRFDLLRGLQTSIDKM